MLTTVERKYLARIPFIAHRRPSRLTFMPILIAFCAMSTILCLMSLFFHSTLPVTEAISSVPPKSSKQTTRIADDVPSVSPFMLP